MPASAPLGIGSAASSNNAEAAIREQQQQNESDRADRADAIPASPRVFVLTARVKEPGPLTSASPPCGSGSAWNAVCNARERVALCVGSKPARASGRSATRSPASVIQTPSRICRRFRRRPACASRAISRVGSRGSNGLSMLAAGDRNRRRVAAADRQIRRIERMLIERRRQQIAIRQQFRIQRRCHRVHRWRSARIARHFANRRDQSATQVGQHVPAAHPRSQAAIDASQGHRRSGRAAVSDRRCAPAA